jgi:hypothetical protein
MAGTYRNSLGIIVYAPALIGSDNRPVAAVHAVERAIPGLRLEWTVSDSHQMIHLPQRDAWLSQTRREGGGFPLICNNDESRPMMVSGLELPARSGPNGQPLLEIHVDLPMDAISIAAMEDLLEGVAENARAFWGHATPFQAALDIARQTKNGAAHPDRPPRGLPALKPSWGIRSPEIPHRLGWLSYWSAAAAQTIGFPDPVRDAELLARARSTSTGGWVFRLTDALLNLDIPDHLEALLRAYERFPKIGGRSAS